MSIGPRLGLGSRSPADTADTGKPGSRGVLGGRFGFRQSPLSPSNALTAHPLEVHRTSANTPLGHLLETKNGCARYVSLITRIKRRFSSDFGSGCHGPASAVCDVSAQSRGGVRKGSTAERVVANGGGDHSMAPVSLHLD